MTSYPARISYVHLAIKSLMLQSYKPDRIILWLAEEQFPTKELPKELTDLCQYGLEIRFVEDLYGHKKYFYIFLRYLEKLSKTNKITDLYLDTITKEIKEQLKEVKQNMTKPKIKIKSPMV